ncbi:MAG: (4Fe-4S)-binding protein [Longimicrobiales bacterium]
MSKAREYEGDGIVVSYELRRCIHAAKCVHGLPEVFDPDRRPWIDPSGSDADRIAAVVERCPTGALTYRRTDGGPAEEAPAPYIRTAPDGPVYVQGSIELRDADGQVYWTGTRAALCRCGASKNKPFCDNTHLDIGFEAP